MLGSEPSFARPIPTTLVAPERDWPWRWTGWASWPLNRATLLLAGATVVVDVASAWAAWPTWHIGRALLSPALPLATLLVLVVGWRRLGGSARLLSAWREFLVGGTITLVVVALALAATTSWHDVAGIAIAVAAEEVVYRVAVVLVVGAACARLAGRDWRDTSKWGTGPVVTALVAGAIVFTALPGHVEQMRGTTSMVPFASLALLLAYTVVRTGSVLPAIVAHAVLDLVTLALIASVLPASGRLLVAVATLTALVLGLLVAGRRLGLRRRVPTVIDLRCPDEQGSPDRVLPTAAG